MCHLAHRPIFPFPFLPAHHRARPPRARPPRARPKKQSRAILRRVAFWRTWALSTPREMARAALASPVLKCCNVLQLQGATGAKIPSEFVAFLNTSPSAVQFSNQTRSQSPKTTCVFFLLARGNKLTLPPPHTHPLNIMPKRSATEEAAPQAKLSLQKKETL